jgi:hypothetical protein
VRTLKKAITVALCTTTMWITMGLQPTEALAGSNGPCSGKRFYVHHGLSAERIRERVKNLIGCATNRWSVAGGYSKALSVADCESGLWPWAYGNGNGGIYQQRTIYWQGRADAYLRAVWFRHWAAVRDHGWFKARANVLLSIRQAHRDGWSAWACQ